MSRYNWFISFAAESNASLIEAVSLISKDDKCDEIIGKLYSDPSVVMDVETTNGAMTALVFYSCSYSMDDKSWKKIIKSFDKVNNMSMGIFISYYREAPEGEVLNDKVLLKDKKVKEWFDKFTNHKEKLKNTSTIEVKIYPQKYEVFGFRETQPVFPGN